MSIYEDILNDEAYYNLDQATKKDPNKQAEVQRVSAVRDLPPQVVNDELPELQRREKVDSTNLSESPKVSAYLRDPRNADVSSDDIETLKALEAALAKRDDDGFLSNTAKLVGNRVVDLGASFVKGAAQISDPIAEKLMEASDFGDVYRDPETGEWSILSYDERKQLEKAGYQSLSEMTPDAMESMRFNAQARHTPEDVKLAFSEDGVLSGLGEAGLFIAEAGIQSLADWGAMAVNFPGYVYARSVEIGEERAKNSDEEATIQHTMEAMPFAIASSLLDRLGRDGIITSGKDTAESIGKEITEHIAKSIGKEALKAGAKEAGTEAIQEGVIEYVGEKWGTEAKMSVSEAMERGAWGALAGGGMGGAIAAPVSAFNERAKRVQAKRIAKEERVITSVNEQEIIDEVISYSQQSQTNKRAAEQFKSFVASASGDQEIIITSDAIIDAMEAGASFPEVVVKQVDIMGGDVVIPMDVFAKDIAPNEELVNALRPHMKMRDDALTPAEIISTEPDLSLEELVARAEAESEVKSEIDGIYDQVKEQLQATGRQSEETARVSAQVIPAYVSAYVSRAKEEGQTVTPAEVFERMGLSIVGPDAEVSAEVVMEQIAESARKIKESDAATLKTGEPVKFRFSHNTQSATKMMGIPDKESSFGRGYEPSGRYISIVRDDYAPHADEIITGDIAFANPLVVDQDNLKWKKTLSDKYGGKTGKKLSKAVIADGYDAIITTEDGKWVSEIVDFTTFDETKALYQSQLAKPESIWDNVPEDQLNKRRDMMSKLKECMNNE